jgi:hypothetical protein
MMVGAFPHHFSAAIRTPFLLTGNAPPMGNLCSTFGANAGTTTAQPKPLVGLHFFSFIYIMAKNSSFVPFPRK